MVKPNSEDVYLENIRHSLIFLKIEEYTYKDFII